MVASLEKVSSMADKMIDEDLSIDMTEQQIINLTYKEELFIGTISDACPMNILASC